MLARTIILLSSNFQASDKASTEISEYTNQVKAITGAFSPFSENTEDLGSLHY